jgi:hypothetical protein
MELCKMVDIKNKNIIVDKQLLLKMFQRQGKECINGKINITDRKIINKYGKTYQYVYIQGDEILSRKIYEYIHNIKLKNGKDVIKFKDNNPLNLSINNLICVNTNEYDKTIRQPKSFWSIYRNSNKICAIKNSSSLNCKNKMVRRTIGLLPEDVFWRRYRYDNYRKAYKLQWQHKNKMRRK